MRSRPSQIAVLVGGADIPFPPIDQEILEVIAEVLGHAFHTLSQEHLQDLATGTEAEVNGLMRGRLNAFLHLSDVARPGHGGPLPELWRQLVKTVGLGEEIPSYNGSSLEKRPDLNIKLEGRHPSFPLVAECKLIDTPKGKSAKMYCDDGVARFQAGDYGWGVREAFMVAYVRDGSFPVQSLGELLAVQEDPDVLDRYGVEQAPITLRDAPFRLSQTRHRRGFKYASALSAEKKPGPISLWHLWLAVPPQA